MFFLSPVLIHFVILSNSDALPDIIKIGKNLKTSLRICQNKCQSLKGFLKYLFLQAVCLMWLTKFRTPARAVRKLPSGEKWNITHLPPSGSPLIGDIWQDSAPVFLFHDKIPTELTKEARKLVLVNLAGLCWLLWKVWIFDPSVIRSSASYLALVNLVWLCRFLWKVWNFVLKI